MNRLEISLQEHPATRAWLSLYPHELAPTRIVELKSARRKSAVYRLIGTGPYNGNVIAKRCPMSTVAVEHTVYQEVLPLVPHPTLRCYGSLPEPDTDSGWLFIEDAGGVPYSTRNPLHQLLAAHWLAVLHTSTEAMQHSVFLPENGIDNYYHDILLSAHNMFSAVQANPVFETKDSLCLGRLVAHCEVVESCWSIIQHHLAEMPNTFVHGGFYSKNVQVGRRGGHQVVLAFDFESAGWGVPAIDLAHEDLAAYYSEIQPVWPEITPQLIENVATMGKILWALKSAIGEETNLTGMWVRRAMDKMLYYDGVLTRAIAAMGWDPR